MQQDDLEKWRNIEFNSLLVLTRQSSSCDDIRCARRNLDQRVNLRVNLGVVAHAAVLSAVDEIVLVETKHGVVVIELE